MSTPGVRFDKSAQFGPGQIGVDPAAEAAIRASHVDLQLSDWGSVSARRAKKDRPDQGGWNLFIPARTVRSSPARWLVHRRS